MVPSACIVRTAKAPSATVAMSERRRDHDNELTASRPTRIRLLSRPIRTSPPSVPAATTPLDGSTARATTAALGHDSPPAP